MRKQFCFGSFLSVQCQFSSCSWGSVSCLMNMSETVARMTTVDLKSVHVQIVNLVPVITKQQGENHIQTSAKHTKDGPNKTACDFSSLFFFNWKKNILKKSWSYLTIAKIFICFIAQVPLKNVAQYWLAMRQWWVTKIWLVFECCVCGGKWHSTALSPQTHHSQCKNKGF